MVKNGMLSSAFDVGNSSFQNLKNTSWTEIGGITLMGGIAAAMVGSVFSSVAWESVTFVSGEVENPKKNIVKAMVWGTTSVMILWLELSNMKQKLT